MQFLQEAESQLASNANNDVQTSELASQQPGTPPPGSPMSMSPQGGSPQAMMPPVGIEQNHREVTDENMDIQHEKSGIQASSPDKRA